MLPAQAAASGWTDAVGVWSGENAHSPQVAVGGDGSATAVWGSAAGGSAIWSSHRPAGGVWGAPVRVSAVGSLAQSASVGIDAAGEVTAVWLWSDGDGYRVQSARRARSGGWTAPVEVVSGGSLTLVFDVAADGGAVVGWEVGDTLRLAVRSPGGAWRPAETVPSPGWHLRWLGVAMDSAGNATALWSAEDGEHYRRVYAASRSGAGDWHAPTALSPAGGDAGGGALAVDGAGALTAAWRWQGDGSRWEAQVVARPAGGGWGGSPVDLSDPEESVAWVELAVNAAGDGAVVWRRTIDGILQGRTRPAGGEWSVAADISSEPASGAAVALDGDGDAIVGWHEPGGAQPGVRAARGRGGSWYEQRTVATVDDATAVVPDVAVDPAGEAATAVWATGGAVWASGRDVSGPELRGLSVPATAIAGEPVTFSVAPWDMWSPIAAFTTWSISGTSYSGDRVTHTFPVSHRRLSSPRGERTRLASSVRVSSSDIGGNTTSASRSIAVIQPPYVPPPPGPRMRLVAPAQSLRSAVRAGALHATCRLEAPGDCRVVAALPPRLAERLRIPGRLVGRRLVIGRGSTSIAKAGRARVRIELVRGAHKALRRIHRHRTIARHRAVARARTPRARSRVRKAFRRAIPVRLHARAKFESAGRLAVLPLPLR